jgi:hypothetical protein
MLGIGNTYDHGERRQCALVLIYFSICEFVKVIALKFVNPHVLSVAPQVSPIPLPVRP